MHRERPAKVWESIRNKSDVKMGYFIVSNKRKKEISLRRNAVLLCTFFSGASLERENVVYFLPAQKYLVRRRKVSGLKCLAIFVILSLMSEPNSIEIREK